MRGLPAALLAALLLITGCSSSAASPRLPASPPPVSPAPTSSPSMGIARASTGCGKTPPTGGTIRVALHGTKLDDLLSLPAGFPNTSAAPLVLNYHGLGSNALQQDIYTRLPIAGTNLGYIVVAPESDSGLPGWILPGFGRRAAGDQRIEIEAARLLLDHLESTLCVDTTRESPRGCRTARAWRPRSLRARRPARGEVAPVSGLTIAQPCAHPGPPRSSPSTERATRWCRSIRPGAPVGADPRVRGAGVSGFGVAAEPPAAVFRDDPRPVDPGDGVRPGGR